MRRDHKTVFGKPKENSLEGLGVDLRITLKRIFKKVSDVHELD
jgi:hypothetical protein